MTESEALVLDGLAWSLAEPVPPRMSQYVEALRAYAEDVGVYFDEKALVRKFSGQSLDVEYTIWVREEVGGDWHPLKKTVFLRFQKRPTYMELLYEFHVAAFDDLSSQDHHFFEGFDFVRENPESGVPIYQVRLVS